MPVTIQNVNHKVISNATLIKLLTLGLGLNQGQRYHPFAVNLHRCMGSCNTLNDLSNAVWFSYKRDDLELIVFDIIRGINEWNL